MSPKWFWPVSEAEAEHLAATDVTLCFPPREPIEIRVVEEGDDA